MKIDSSTMAMVSNHFKEDKHTEVSELKAWIDPRTQSSTMDTVCLSDQIYSKIKEEKMAELDQEEVIKNDPKLLLIKELIEALTGKEIILGKRIDDSANSQGVIIDMQSDKGKAEPSNHVGWGVRYEYDETDSEKEETAFVAGGIIKTTDGKEINFTLSLTMRREFIQSTRLSVRAGDALLDPLVINFDGKAAELTNQRFAFDLNADGVNENIPFVTEGSGILVLDRNGDQLINDGGELFGPTTGNGFHELSEFDQTQDGWIDENDAIYSRLAIWTRDSDSVDRLRDLKTSGVGAIYLSAVETSFDLKTVENTLDGRIKKTGIYLSENGQAGTAQQIDMAV